tara:strand:+ start:338 stop:574 length:237 start_codon:yes stop_codon:yes gene_type:complete
MWRRSGHTQGADLSASAPQARIFLQRYLVSWGAGREPRHFPPAPPLVQTEAKVSRLVNPVMVSSLLNAALGGLGIPLW